MRSALYDHSVIHHTNLIRILNGGQPVSDHDTRASLLSIIQSGLHQLSEEKQEN